MLTVSRVQQEKFAVDGIAEREAVRFREASDRVEKKLLALIRILKFPRFAAVCRLVDARLFAFATGHQIGNLLGERHDPAKASASPPLTGRRFHVLPSAADFRIIPFEPDAPTTGPRTPLASR